MLDGSVSHNRSSASQFEIKPRITSFVLLYSCFSASEKYKRTWKSEAAATNSFAEAFSYKGMLTKASFTLLNSWIARRTESLLVLPS